MNIIANNTTEVLLALIALAGEIPKNIEIAEVSDKTLQNQISKAKKASILKVDTKHNRVRLKAPHGLEALENYSEELYLHYNMVSNNHQFQTSKKAVDSQKTFSKTVIQMLKCGYEIDNIRIIHKSNHFGKNEEEKDEIDLVLGGGLLDIGMDKFAANGEIVPLVESASLMTKNERRFYTSKYLKHGVSINDRINISRISGILLSEGNLYNVYNLEDGSKIFKSAETDMNEEIRKIYTSAYGKLPKGFEAIIITGMIPARTERLDSIFSHYYFIPENEYGNLIIRILSCENWKAKLQEAIYGESSRDSRIDGIMNGVLSWELLTCEYNKVQRLKKIAGNNPVNFVIFGWQEDSIRVLTKGLNCSFQILTEEQELILLDYMEN